MKLDNLSAWLATAFLVVALLFDVRRDLRRLVSARSVVLVGIFSWFLLEGITLSPVLSTYPQDTYDFSIFCVALATIFYLIGYHVTAGPKFFLRVGPRFSVLDDPDRLFQAMLLCAAIGFAPILYYSSADLIALIKGILGLRKTWGGAIGRGRYGDAKAAILMLENFAIGAGPLAMALLLNRRTSLFQKVVAVPMIIWPLLRAYGTGTRSAMLTSFLPVAAVFYFKASPKVQRRMIFCTVFLALPLYKFMAAMVISRGAGEFSWSSASKATYVGSEMLQEMAYITTNIPMKLDYQWGHSYYVQLVNPIPRFLWPGKPTLETGILLARMKGAVGKGGDVFFTNSPGLIGEMYLNFGLFGIVALSAFGGWLTRGWDRLPETCSHSICTMIFYSMGLAVLYILGRSFTLNLFYGMICLYIGVCIAGLIWGTKVSTPGRLPQNGAGLRPIANR